MDRYLKYGFEYYDMRYTRPQDRTNVKEVHISVYSDLPEYNLLSNMNEEDAVIRCENNRIIFEGKSKMILSNIGINNIARCMVKKHNEHTEEFIYEVGDVYYKGVVVKH